MRVYQQHINLKTSNIKSHFIIDDNYLNTLNHFLSSSFFITKKKPSFCMFKYKTLIYTCFYSGYINVTGLKTLGNIYIPKYIFSSQSGIPLKSISLPVIDNISAKYIKVRNGEKTSRDLHCFINILRHDHRIISLKYNRERFPGLFIKTINGTIIWFPSNSIITVGCKHHSDLQEIDKIIKQYE